MPNSGPHFGVYNVFGPCVRKAEHQMVCFPFLALLSFCLLVYHHPQYLIPEWEEGHLHLNCLPSSASLLLPSTRPSNFLLPPGKDILYVSLFVSSFQPFGLVLYEKTLWEITRVNKKQKCIKSCFETITYVTWTK